MEYILLTGHRKSGTSLLHKLFDSHSGLNVYPVDISLLYAFYPAWVDNSIRPDAKKARVESVIQSSTTTIHGKMISETIREYNPKKFLEILWKNYDIADLTSPLSIIEAIAHTYTGYANLDASKPFLLKETSQTINLPLIDRDNASIKTLQIIRDPRDNYAAIKAGKKYYESIGERCLESLASLIYRSGLDMRLAEQYVNQGKDNFSTIKFEDLVRNPKEVINYAASFLGIDEEDSLLTPTVLGEAYYGNNHNGMKFHGISKANVGKWISRISQFEACVIEAALRVEMQAWDYQNYFSEAEQLKEYCKFYGWMNHKYFYYDSFEKEGDS